MTPYQHKVGPLLLLVALNPVQAGGAGWTFLGPTDGDTVFSPGIQKSHAASDLVGSTPLAGGTYLTGYEATLTCQLLDETRATLKAYLSNAAVLSSNSQSIGLAAGIQKVAEPWLVGIPFDEVGQGVNAPNAIWIPAADLTDFGSFTNKRPEGGQKTTNPRQTVFRALYRSHVVSPTAAAPGNAALPQGANIAFIGKPSDFSITGITLPTLTTFVPAQVA